MPSDDTSSQNRNSAPSDSRRWPDDETALDAVRRFADEQVSSVLQSVMGIPSMSSRPSPDHWAIFDEEAFRRRDGGGDAKGVEHAPGTAPGAADNSDHYNQRHNRYPAHSWRDWDDQWYADNHPRWRRSDRDFFDYFFDRASLFDSPFSSRFFHPFHRSMFSDFASNSFGWPFSYLLFSPYSPLHLERQDQYHSHRDRGVFSSLMSSLSLSSENENNNPATESHWREAFEDLIRLENGKPMLDQDTTALAKRETARDWLYGLAKRGSLGDQWKISESGRDGRSNPMLVFHDYTSDRGDGGEVSLERTADENETETMTELDMFDRFFEDAAARESKAIAEMFESPILRLLLEERRRPRDTDEKWLEPVSDKRNENTVPDTLPENKLQSTPVTESTTTTEQPTVISTMTRTERVRLPDGSTQKKTVWTKRFSDGREESNETTEVLNPPHGQNSTGDSSSANQKESGWFWRD
ncbi:hypothetical protein CBS63078_1748 [Aspergillus niger]|uniref:Contig An09c0170, genomic contig n=4 Tax=Aspergillus niger TaxID=5061 RepID=A2QUH4_ASPNC|nr:uncharacterized protein An09g05655 [Aspergillus niger]XP_025449349.1 uncharacterized protein BO96DRAFT_416433 [Aspergillus niger CBS 101883]EHA28521.1 hypothetical protein ASPNIDRAFT_212456 [Aspergillus niger ATCC 1015]RDH15788.1 hypothetical protein M747DRAFT_374049 [Aspergillus niger ATCC 13496]KAI2823160.1 hypothetical protein CBS115989_1538 [Aspergillus niger]KAI2846232.1 hypothetical protein CBS11350_3772 [Aspergillus niger]KAI2847170.1 hypothetical protein CBS11232_7204 [Aspergillus |eukprot:XP_001393876.1 hypothetical protein ANI_1_708084 [Aspergillus niger CBS 513.88]